MEKSSFFNAELVGEEYDRTYLAEDYAQYFASFIGNGVFPNPSTNLQVLADSTNMNVVLKSGKAWINGYFYNNTDDLILAIIPADGVLNRIDRVVLRLDFLNREIKCYVKKGAFASTPTAPSLQRDADMYEIALADIKVNKGAIAITQANITDLRQDSDYCGIVHGTVDQVDVTTLFNQYENALELKEQGFEEEFQSWFDSIKGQLSGDVAANLAGQIADINEHLGEVEKQLSNYNSYASVKDGNGIFTVVEFKRPDNTLYMKSTLSGGTSPNYTTDTWEFYNTGGVETIKTIVWTITYDSDGAITSKVVSS